jgi:phosphoglycerate dehydrogenase-like enzyme
MATNIAVLDDYQDVALSSADWSELSGHSSITVFNDYIADQDRLIETLQPFEVVVAMRERTPFPADVIRALPRLKLLITTGPANASIDVAAATEQGITVCGTGGLLNPTSELTWGLILAVARNIPQEDQAIRAGRWQTSVGIELGGRTLGIIGLGKLGQRVARVAHAFDMNVIAWSQNLTAETAAEHGATLVTKEVLFAESDIVTVHLVLSDRTRGLIGSAELGLMRPTSYLVNTSRGPIVDEAALVAALASGAIAGAGLDVFDREPLPSDHPFRSLANTVLTPHIGYVGQETYRIFYADIVDDISNWLAGTPVRVIS